MPTPVSPTIVIQADYQEQRSGVPALLAQQPGVELQLRQLEIGDYLLDGDPLRVIERKQANDFVLSITDKRLFRQLEALVGSSGIAPVLILEGDPLRTGSRIHPNAIRGALTYIVGILHLPILPSTGAADTAALLWSLAKQVQLGYKQPDTNLTRKGATLAEQQQAVLLALPGVGSATAQSLLARFGSVEGVIQATAEELATISGITPARAALLTRILHASYEAEPAKHAEADDGGSATSQEAPGASDRKQRGG